MRPEAQAWWELAEQDFATAKTNLDAGAFYMCAFLSQQCVEKGMKAVWIVKHQTHAPKTHNLLDLADGLGVTEEIRTLLRRLNPQYVAPRYPDAANGAPPRNYDRNIAGDLLREAGEVMTWCRNELKGS